MIFTYRDEKLIIQNDMIDKIKSDIFNYDFILFISIHGNILS